MSIRRELLDILACPRCKGEVILSDTEDGVICGTCGLMYPVRNGIPVMLVSEAVKRSGLQRAPES